MSRRNSQLTLSNNSDYENYNESEIDSDRVNNSHSDCYSGINIVINSEIYSEVSVKVLMINQSKGVLRLLLIHV